MPLRLKIRVAGCDISAACYALSLFLMCLVLLAISQALVCLECPRILRNSHSGCNLPERKDSDVVSTKQLFRKQTNNLLYPRAMYCFCGALYCVKKKIVEKYTDVAVTVFL